VIFTLVVPPGSHRPRVAGPRTPLRAVCVPVGVSVTRPHQHRVG